MRKVKSAHPTRLRRRKDAHAGGFRTLGLSVDGLLAGRIQALA